MVYRRVMAMENFILKSSSSGEIPVPKLRQRSVPGQLGHDRELPEELRPSPGHIGQLQRR